jgi:hypothetical protein
VVRSYHLELLAGRLTPPLEKTLHSDPVWEDRGILGRVCSLFSFAEPAMPHFRFFRLPEASPWRLMDPASPATTSTKPQRLLLMDSQQTDQDRRQVRTRERQFLNDIKENASELILLESDKFFRATQELDVMYEHVCYPREANLDGLCLGELDTSLGKQSKMLSGTDMTKVK